MHTEQFLTPLAMALRIALAAAALATASAGPALAQAQAIQYDIPAGPLADALNRFALQSGMAIAVDARQLQGLRTPGLSGRHGVDEGFGLLLQGSGHVVEKTGAGYVLRPAPVPPRPAAEGEKAALPPVTVTAQRAGETATGPVQGYVARRSATATKTDTPLIETPQSVSVITRDDMDTRQSSDLFGALAYTAGVAFAPYTDRVSDEILLRGFNIYASHRDGLKYQVNRFDGQQEPYGLERIDVMKGASSVLYGATQPGGVVNVVSKRPSANPIREVGIDLGSFNRRQFRADVGGADQDGVWSYRLVLLKRKSDASTDFTPDDRVYAAPSLKWQPNGQTSLTLLAEYQKDDTIYAGDGLPKVGTLLPNVNGRLPRGRFLGEPGFDRFDIEKSSVGYLFEHAFDGSLKLRHGLRYFSGSQDWKSVGVDGLQPDGRTTAFRGTDERENQVRALTLDTSLQYDWGLGGVKNTTLFGIDYRTQNFVSMISAQQLPDIDIFAPVYTGVGAGTLTRGWDRDMKQLGLYAQHQAKIADQWVVLLGGRQDEVRDDNINPLNGAVTVDGEKTSKFTGRVGAVYLGPNGLAPFVSFSQSFEPQGGLSSSGQRYLPSDGQQVEVGVRYQPSGASTLLSAAVYELTRTNIVDSVNEVQIGEERSRGVELEAKTRLGQHAHVLAAYAYTETITTRSNPATLSEQGKRTAGIPLHQFSLWGDYGFGALGLEDLKAGLGVRYVGSKRADYSDDVVPAYRVFDAMVAYDTSAWRLALNVSNLADKTYVSSCPWGCYYGEPRKAVVSATYRW